MPPPVRSAVVATTRTAAAMSQPPIRTASAGMSRARSDHAGDREPLEQPVRPEELTDLGHRALEGRPGRVPERDTSARRAPAAAR